MKDKIEIEDIKRIHLNKGDVLKVKVDNNTSSRDCGVLYEMLSNIFPNNKILIVTGNIEFEVVEGGNDNV